MSYVRIVQQTYIIFLKKSVLVLFNRWKLELYNIKWLNCKVKTKEKKKKKEKPSRQSHSTGNELSCVNWKVGMHSDTIYSMPSFIVYFQHSTNIFFCIITGNFLYTTMFLLSFLTIFFVLQESFKLSA